jgi:hypothetical protein
VTVQPEELSLCSIDSMCHLWSNEETVSAVAFAARAGHSDRTAYRFLTALGMTDNLTDRTDWPEVLLRVMDLERS